MIIPLHVSVSSSLGPREGTQQGAQLWDSVCLQPINKRWSGEAQVPFSSSLSPQCVCACVCVAE